MPGTTDRFWAVYNALSGYKHSKEEYIRERSGETDRLPRKREERVHLAAECHAARTESQASAAEPSLHSASLARLAAYVFNHYNWKFDFLRLTVTEIVNEYLKVHVLGSFNVNS